MQPYLPEWRPSYLLKQKVTLLQEWELTQVVDTVEEVEIETLL